MVTELCCRHGTWRATFFAWKAKYGGIEVPEARRLKRLIAVAMLDKAGLKDLLSKKGVSAAARRAAFAHLKTEVGMSEAMVGRAEQAAGQGSDAQQ